MLINLYLHTTILKILGYFAFSMLIVKKVKTSIERKEILQVRHQVFVEEQGVPADLEYDIDDAISTHFAAYYNKQICGTARWRFYNSGIIKLERFAVLKPYRRKGIAQKLLETILIDLPYCEEIILHAQEQVVPFYLKNSFEILGNTFIEAGITHVKMKYSPNKQL